MGQPDEEIRPPEQEKEIYRGKPSFKVYTDQDLSFTHPSQQVGAETLRIGAPSGSITTGTTRDSEPIPPSLADLRITSTVLSTFDTTPGSPNHETLENATHNYHAFIRTSRKQYIDESIDGFRRAVEHTPQNHPSLPQRKYLLASALICRYRNTNAHFQDLEDGVALADQVVRGDLDHHLKQSGKSLKGWGWYMRYLRTGHGPDIVASVDLLNEVVNHTCQEDQWLANLRLALALIVLYHANAGEDLVAKAEQVARRGLSERHPQSAEPMLQDTLSRVLYAKYRNAHRPSQRDVLEAQDAAERALQATPPTHIHYAAYAQNRCRLYLWYMPPDKVAEDAIAIGERAFRATPDGYRRRYMVAQAISNVSDLKTSRDGRKEDLEEAMWWARISAQTPELHHRPICETGLCRWMIRRFEQYGQPDDVDTAIDMLRPIADGITAKAIDNIQFARHYIVYAFFARFHWHGDERDLDELIRYAVMSEDSPLQGTREHETALAHYRSCFERYKRSKRLEDLDYALMKTLETIPRSDVAWHTMQPSDTWSVLGDMHFCRYRELGEGHDFEEGVAWCRRVLDHHGSALIDKTQAMHLLAGGFGTRAEIQRSIEDLQQAIVYAERCTDMVPRGHSLRADFVGHLGDLYALRYERLENETDLQKALDNYRSATVDSASVVRHRFRACTAFASLAHRVDRLETALRSFCLERLRWLATPQHVPAPWGNTNRRWFF
ncbi:hypothetical protein DACRYDRAFT_14737 [Dacryopinax primogenitus]|uniref:TPR-like protein n=1 Tax=Dacryopinax primogenitus (strain DJM 731) TaxID=1858805 RepID=M5G665_DACPD|nr:uncharacterized protein DACRYDRAFT_14737 [Dacryopinax primogenitus]EJU03690.1 hypothetical protein DACRYDRAFT_14737 [Dacryopinax primogenitus]